MTNDTKVSWLSLSKIHTILKVYLWLYAIAVVFILIYLLLIGFLTFEGQPHSLTDVLVKIFELFVLATLFFGVAYKKSWTPTTITILTSFGLVSILFSLAGAQTPIFHYHFMEIAYFCLVPLIAMWQLFTLYFFNTKQVRAYFKVSGLTVF
jgi:hypothetical protein